MTGMSMIKSKKNAIILYAVYSVLLVLIITFANGVGEWLADILRNAVIVNEITDVVIEVEDGTDFEAKHKYEFDYTVIGKYQGNADIYFESSNTDALIISSGAKVVVNTYAKFDGDETDVDVTVKSRKDTSFEKTLTFTVKKIHPTADDVKVSYLLEGCGYNKSRVKVGMKIYPYSAVKDSKYTNEYEVLYDPEYISYDEETGSYYAIKETPDGEKICFTMSYPNGVQVDTASFSVIPDSEVESFDEIRSGGNALEDEIYIQKGKGLTPLLYRGGKLILSRVDISYSDTDGIRVEKNGSHTFKKIGDYVLTVALPNGFSKEITVHVRNVVALPQIKSSADIDGNRITVKQSDERVRVDLVYPDGTTLFDHVLEYDGETVKINDSKKSFTIIPKKVGETTLKVVWDDGYERVEDTYVVEVVKSNSSATHRVKAAITFFVSKILGHSVLFAILGALTLGLFRYIPMKNEALLAAIYLASVLPTAVLTEFIQKFQPGRHARVVDVLIDACGFLAGTSICALVAYKRARKTCRSHADGCAACARVMRKREITNLSEKN